LITVYKCINQKITPVGGLDHVSPHEDNFWIDLHEPTAEEDRLVENFLNLNVPTREDMREIESSSRLYNEDGAEFMTVIAVAKLHLDDPTKTEVTFILTPRCLVTVRYADLLSFTHYKEGMKKKDAPACSNAEDIMFDIIESMIDRIADSLETLGDEIDTLSAQIFRHRKVTVKSKTDMLEAAIQRIGVKGDLLSMLRESLATISRLMSHHNPDLVEEAKFTKASRTRMGMLGRDVLSLNDHAAFMSTKINFLLDATLGMINLEQNQIIKIFSIAAVMFLPPTLVASVYGMNFHDMPELDWRFGYPLALLAMVISGTLPVLYFKKKGWL